MCLNKEEVLRDDIIKTIQNELLKQPLVTKIEYISIASHISMKELDNIRRDHGVVISCAIRLGNVRLIDNLLVGKAEHDIYI